MATTRRSRSDTKARTRADLIEAARQVFFARGFHRATLDEIAEQAGYTKGAVYSNFEDKDALFLAVLEAHYEQRVQVYAPMMLDDGDDLEEAWRGVSSFMADADASEPRWLPLLSEFTAYAVRHEAVCAELVRTRARFLEEIARIIDESQTKWRISYRISPFEIARFSSVLIRGFSAERQLDPSAMTPELFVEIHTAFLRGLSLPAERS